MAKFIRILLFIALILSYHTAYADMVYRNQEFGINFILPIKEIKFPRDKTKVRFINFVNKAGKASDCKLDGLNLGKCVAKIKDENWLFALVETDEAGRVLGDIYVKVEYSNDSTESSRSRSDTLAELRSDKIVSHFINSDYDVRWAKRDDYIEVTANKDGDCYTGYIVARLGRKVTMWSHHNKNLTKWGINGFLQNIKNKMDFDATMGASEFDIKIVNF